MQKKTVTRYAYAATKINYAAWSGKSEAAAHSYSLRQKDKHKHKISHLGVKSNV